MLRLFIDLVGFWMAVYWLIRLVYRTFGYFFPHKMGWSYFQDTLAAWCGLRKEIARLEKATGVRWSTNDIAEAYQKGFDLQSLRFEYRVLLHEGIQREQEIIEHNARLRNP